MHSRFAHTLDALHTYFQFDLPSGERQVDGYAGEKKNVSNII
jgi:hypothetical protein